METVVVLNRWNKAFCVELKSSNRRARRIFKTAPENDCSKLLIHPAPRAMPGAQLSVSPEPDLLHRFVNLRSASDEEVYRFCKKYGGLGVFCGIAVRPANAAMSFSVEYCQSWRYFASAMTAMLKIASAPWPTREFQHPAWAEILNVPGCMATLKSRYRPSSLTNLSLDFEGEWLSFIELLKQSPGPLDWHSIAATVNLLLDVADVQQRLIIQSDRTLVLGYKRPSLFTYVVQQLGLTIARADTLVVCCHCAAMCDPESDDDSRSRRAPKSGQRNFCSACRKAKVPQRYASRAARARRWVKLYPDAENPDFPVPLVTERPHPFR